MAKKLNTTELLTELLTEAIGSMTQRIKDAVDCECPDDVLGPERQALKWLKEMLTTHKKARREPFTHDDLLKLKTHEEQAIVHVEGVVAIPLDQVMCGIDAFNDVVSGALIGRPELLQGIEYNLVAADPSNDELFFWVEGDLDLEDW